MSLNLRFAVSFIDLCIYIYICTSATVPYNMAVNIETSSCFVFVTIHILATSGDKLQPKRAIFQIYIT